MNGLLTNLTLVVIISTFIELAVAQQYLFTKLLKDNGENLQWDSTLIDQNNQQFLQLASKVRSKIGLLFINTTGIDDIHIKTFRPGLGVLVDFTVVLQNDTNTTLNKLSIIINTTKWIDITSGKQPRLFKVTMTITHPTWKDSYTDTSSEEYSSLVVTAKSFLINVYKKIPGFLEVIILGVTKSDDGTSMKSKVLFDFMSVVLSTDMEKMLKTSSLQGSTNRSLRLGEVSVQEENLASNPPEDGKPTWLLVLIALACISIFAGIVAFLSRVIKQSCAAPKFKFNEDKAADESVSRRTSHQPSRNSTETLTAEPHHNCIRPASAAAL